MSYFPAHCTLQLSVAPMFNQERIYSGSQVDEMYSPCSFFCAVFFLPPLNGSAPKKTFVVSFSVNILDDARRELSEKVIVFIKKSKVKLLRFLVYLQVENI